MVERERSKRISVVLNLEEDGPFEEKYEEPLSKELGIGHEWVLWEQYTKAEPNHQRGGGHGVQDSKAYLNTMQKIGCFNDIISFWQMWNFIPHKDLKHFFYDRLDQI